MAREWAGATPQRASVTLVVVNLLQPWCHRVSLSLWDQSGFLWVSTCDRATIMNLGWFSSRALLSCRTASLELNWSFPNPRLPNRMHLTASKWMWQRIACIIAPWRLSSAFSWWVQGWWPLLLNKADSRQGSLALCYPAFVMALRLSPHLQQIAGVSHILCLLTGIVFFNVFKEQLHGRIVINLNNKQQWLKEVGSCLFCWDGRLAS